MDKQVLTLTQLDRNKKQNLERRNINTIELEEIYKESG
jgi:hypothetical protein